MRQPHTANASSPTARRVANTTNSATSNPAAADAYGWARYLAGDLPGALELLAKASALAPKNAGVLMRLAQVRAEINREAKG